MAHKDRLAVITSAKQFFKQRKVRAFFNLVDNLTVAEGTRALLQASGIGRLKPNILLMGYKLDWQRCSPEEIVEYFDLLQ
jgi:solute carrier family 12 (sodium/potassium/chloride transporter), member 2